MKFLSRVEFDELVMTEDTELVSAERERMLGSLEVNSDHMPGKAVKRG